MYTWIVMSGRDGSCFDATRAWAGPACGEGLPLHMRAEGDDRTDAIVKHEMFPGTCGKPVSCGMRFR